MTAAPKIVGIVLAAGQSRRMGRPKALLRTAPAGQHFVSKLVATLTDAGVDEVVVVGRSRDETLRSVVEELRTPARYVVNAAPERGQLSSLNAGLDAAESSGAEAIVVMPVDMPLVRTETIRTALASLRNSSAPIVRICHQGHHGHPVLFRRETFADLRRADPSAGARAVVRQYAHQVLEVDVDDPGVLRDFDWPEEYRRVFGREP
jgi:CTP:molybdopterin cytidylyltransferase MocA